ncbi:hypothetical protein TcBrA4_0136600 [Trypanosoma cruzi]|nr:hypothetical protein TcBrA4_0136600 [Trypanosoma cruzi]
MGVGSHKRSQGEAAFTQTSHATPLPALLRPQFQVFGEDNLNAIDRRLRRGEAERVEEKKNTGAMREGSRAAECRVAAKHRNDSKANCTTRFSSGTR